MRNCAKELLVMGKVDQIVSSLEKLYSKRGALDKQIAEAEKKLASEVKTAAKPVAAAVKPAAKKATAKKAAPKAAPKK